MPSGAGDPVLGGLIAGRSRPRPFRLLLAQSITIVRSLRRNRQRPMRPTRTQEWIEPLDLCCVRRALRGPQEHLHELGRVR